MTIKEGDFVAIEFTGTLTDTGDVFDTNIKEQAKTANLKEADMKPFICSVGHKMLPPGFDKALQGNEIGTTYTINLNAKEAFGEREKKLVQMVPTKLFHEQNIQPQRGMQLSLEGRLVRILSSDRGRTLVDFNGPLAGKKVTYKYKILQKITEEKEQINALQDFLFRKRFEFKEKEGKIVFKTTKKEEHMIQLLAPKIKEIIGKDIEVEITKEKTSPAADTPTTEGAKEKNPAHGEPGHVHGPDCNHKH